MSAKHNTLLAIAAISAGAATALAAPASANTLFDSQVLGEPHCSDAGSFCTTEQRNAGNNYAAVLQFSADTTVNQIGLWSSVGGDQDIKFLIFESARNGGSGDLLFSQLKTFANNDAQAWLYTDAISFTFLAGHTYDVGILGNGNTLTGRWIYPNDLTQGAVTEIGHNANFNNYELPTTGDYAGVSPWVQLNDNGAAVPEPASWALMIVGFGLSGAALRRRAALVAVAA